MSCCHLIDAYAYAISFIYSTKTYSSLYYYKSSYERNYKFKLWINAILRSVVFPFFLMEDNIDLFPFVNIILKERRTKNWVCVALFVYFNLYSLSVYILNIVRINRRLSLCKLSFKFIVLNQHKSIKLSKFYTYDLNSISYRLNESYSKFT